MLVIYNRSLILFAMGMTCCQMVFCQHQQDTLARFGSSDQVDNILISDAGTSGFLFDFLSLHAYFDFKTKVETISGIKFATEYDMLLTGTTSDVGEGTANSGLWKVYGSWELVGKKSGNSGSLIFKVEHRHKYSEIPPKNLGLDMGYVGFIAAPFNNDGWRATNLYWRQRFYEGRIALVAGFMDVTDFFDVYGLTSPWLHFTNLAFSTGGAAVNLPNDGYLGLAMGAWLSKRTYLVAGFGDINSDPTDIFNGFDTFFNTNEYFKHVEIGFSSSREAILLDNIHLSFWQRDATSATGDPDGWGLILSASKYLKEKYFPFIRYAYTQDAGSLLQHSLSLGFGYQSTPGGNLLAFGANWGQVNETTFGAGLEDQYSMELFYRFQVSPLIALTPDLQFFINPALNQEQSSIFLYSLRARIVL